ncbi:hypothetical protein D931_00194 [Enterococcus faecium 13.SD.W.09]|nr:hypothetical protein D931_00194 [Enterococcus faecium 13.SD.W.09]
MFFCRFIFFEKASWQLPLPCPDQLRMRKTAIEQGGIIKKEWMSPLRKSLVFSGCHQGCCFFC